MLTQGKRANSTQKRPQLEGGCDGWCVQGNRTAGDRTQMQSTETELMQFSDLMIKKWRYIVES